MARHHASAGDMVMSKSDRVSALKELAACGSGR